MDVSVGIIGAGIAGMSCGYELAKRGIEVVILEKNEKVGGRHRTEVYDGYVVDVAAAMFSPAHEPYFLAYFRELGIEGELNVPPTSAKKFALQYGNKLIPLTKSAMTFSGLYSFSDLRKMGKFDRYLKKLHFDYNEFDPEQQKNHRISTTDFFQRWGFSDEFTDRFVQPFTAMNYVSPDKMSAATELRLVAHSSAINIRPKNGMSIVANKLKGIRAANCTNVKMAEMSRRHNNANILALGARILKPEEAKEITETWLVTPFDGDRHQRRLDQIAELEK